MFNEFENQELVHAIAAAERGSTGELRVLIVNRCRGDVMDKARRAFEELGLTETQGRTGVLLYFCARDHKLAILGDVGIHEKVGQAFWNQIIERAIAFCREGEYLRALLLAVDEIGHAFRRHLPPEQGEGNELPDHPVYR